MPKDTSKIPTGYYCYQTVIVADERVIRVCPYWSKRHDKAPQENGYCSYLERGDWEVEGLSLLWDQVKECGENTSKPSIKDIDKAYLDQFTEKEQNEILRARGIPNKDS